MRVERVDVSVLLIADEYVSAELPKAIRGARHTPGRIQHATLREAAQQMTVRIEHIDKAIARTCHVIVLLCVLLGIGYPQIAVDVLDTKGRKAVRNMPINEPPIGRDCCKVGVEY